MKKSSISTKKNVTTTATIGKQKTPKTGVLTASSVSSSEFHTWEKGTDDVSRMNEDLMDSSDDEDSVSISSIPTPVSTNGQQLHYKGNALGKQVKKMPIVYDKDTDDSDDEGKNRNGGDENDEESKNKENEDDNNRVTPKLALKDMLTPEQIAAKEDNFKNLLHHVKLALKTSIFNFEAAMGELEISRDLIKQSEIERKRESQAVIDEQRNEKLLKKLDEIQFSGSSATSKQDNLINSPGDNRHSLEASTTLPIHSSLPGSNPFQVSDIPMELRKSLISDDLSVEETTNSAQQSQDIDKSTKKFNTTTTMELLQSDVFSLDANRAMSAAELQKDIDLSQVRITKSSKQYSFVTNLNSSTIVVTSNNGVDETTTKIENKHSAQQQEEIDVKSLSGSSKDQSYQNTIFSMYKPKSIGFDLRNNIGHEDMDNNENDSMEEPDEDSTLQTNSNLTIATENLINATNAYKLLTTNLRSMSANNSNNTTPRDMRPTDSKVVRAISMPNILSPSKSNSAAMEISTLKFRIPQQAKDNISRVSNAEVANAELLLRVNRNDESLRHLTLSDLEQRILNLSAATPRQNNITATHVPISTGNNSLDIEIDQQESSILSFSSMSKI